MKIRLFGLYRTVEIRALLSGLEPARIPPTHERELPKAKPSFDLNRLEQMLLESRLATIA